MLFMKPYSIDLRERVVHSVESGECTLSEAAERFEVSTPSLERWLARQRKTGNCAPLPHAGGSVRVLATAESVIRAAVKAQPDVTLAELCAVVKTQLNCTVDTSMMCRELTRLKLPRKKSRNTPASVTHRASSAAAPASRNA